MAFLFKLVYFRNSERTRNSKIKVDKSSYDSLSYKVSFPNEFN